MAAPLSTQMLRSLLLEYLSTKPNMEDRRFEKAVVEVIQLAVAKRLYPAPTTRYAGPVIELKLLLKPEDQQRIPELIRHVMWRLLIQGIIVFGKDQDNQNWPFYTLTEYGEFVVGQGGPQPYDPDGFLRDFLTKNPNVDPVILDYVTEAVVAFNANCPKSTAVMVGAASEKAILVLYDTFLNAITLAAEKANFEKATNWTILSHFAELHDRLLKMVAAKKLDKALAEIVKGELPGLFQLIRRHRNAAGHPELLGNISSDDVFLNLRVFPEYISRVYQLILYFQANPAVW
ncbi:MAG TPA: hypothetical protein VGL38_09520 [bacterium]